MKLLFIF